MEFIMKEKTHSIYLDLTNDEMVELQNLLITDGLSNEQKILVDKLLCSARYMNSWSRILNDCCDVTAAEKSMLSAAFTDIA